MKSQIRTVQKYGQRSTDRSGVKDLDSIKRKRSIKMARPANQLYREVGCS